MAKQRIILVVLVCFSLTALAAQRPSGMPKLPLRKRGMSTEEYRKEVEKAIEQHDRQEAERSKEYINLMARQAWKQLLWVSDQQCKLIEQKREKVGRLYREMHVGAAGGGRNEESFRWYRPSESSWNPMKGKARDQKPEGYRIVEELIDLLEDENAKDEEIRLKIDALQRAREKAKKELPKAKQELAAVLTSPRQEAVLLLLGYID